MSVACAPETAAEHQGLGEPDRPVETPERAQGRRLDPQRLGDHAARLYRAAYGLCGSREDAEDLVQDTYERILRRPRFVRHENDLAYLLRVMRNTWISSGAGPPRDGGADRRRGGRRDPRPHSDAGDGSRIEVDGDLRPLRS